MNHGPETTPPNRDLMVYRPCVVRNGPILQIHEGAVHPARSGGRPPAASVPDPEEDGPETWSGLPV
jgi:hypothetical protein